MPHNLYQWLVYVAVVIVGVFVSGRTQWFFMHKVLKSETVVRKALKGIEGDPAAKLPSGHLGTKLQEWVGAIEIILYASSVVFGYPEFIAVWFATKYVSSYKTWAKEPVGRTMYNRSLFGSGLNILLGFFTGRVALWAISYFGTH
jgi:hypothetical protein